MQHAHCCGHPQLLATNKCETQTATHSCFGATGSGGSCKNTQAGGLPTLQYHRFHTMPVYRLNSFKKRTLSLKLWEMLASEANRDCALLLEILQLLFLKQFAWRNLTNHKTIFIHCEHFLFLVLSPRQPPLQICCFLQFSGLGPGSNVQVGQETERGRRCLKSCNIYLVY